jgi:hypothetical protein
VSFYPWIRATKKSGSGSGIRDEQPRSYFIGISGSKSIRIQGFDDQKLEEKIYSKKNTI